MNLIEKEKINKNCDNKSKNEAEIINNKLDLNNNNLNSKFEDNLKISIIEPNNKDESKY